jgi:hypothetical protein
VEGGYGVLGNLHGHLAIGFGFAGHIADMNHAV